MPQFPTQAQAIAQDILVRLMLAEDIKRARDKRKRVKDLMRAAMVLGQKLHVDGLPPKEADELAIKIEQALMHHIQFAAQLASEGGLIPKDPQPDEK